MVKRIRMFLDIRDTAKTELVLASDYDKLEKLCVDFARAVGEALIDQELKSISHECDDWDGLRIDGGDPEMTGCTCTWSDPKKAAIAEKARDRWSKQLDAENERNASSADGRTP